VPAWVQVEGHEPHIASQSDGAGGLRIQAIGLPQLSPGAPTFRMHVYGPGGLEELSSEPVTVNRPELILSPQVVGVGQHLIAVLETPFGALLTPVDVSV